MAALSPTSGSTQKITPPSSLCEPQISDSHCNIPYKPVWRSSDTVSCSPVLSCCADFSSQTQTKPLVLLLGLISPSGSLVLKVFNVLHFTFVLYYVTYIDALKLISCSKLNNTGNICSNKICLFSLSVISYFTVIWL